jgi:xylose isomerase
VHLNDQNGPRFDQNKAVGAENLRQAFNQVRALVENAYGRHGEYVGIETRSMRTQPAHLAYRHLQNSLHIIQRLEEKARQFDYGTQKKFVDARDYEGLEMYVMDLLMGE